MRRTVSPVCSGAVSRYGLTPACASPLLPCAGPLVADADGRETEFEVELGLCMLDQTLTSLSGNCDEEFLRVCVLRVGQHGVDVAVFDDLALLHHGHGVGSVPSPGSGPGLGVQAFCSVSPFAIWSEVVALRSFCSTAMMTSAPRPTAETHRFG